MYKLDKEWFDSNSEGIISFGRFSKVRGSFSFVSKENINSASKNQLLLEELYNMKKPYVSLVKENNPIVNSNKKIKKSYKDESKQTKSNTKEK
jgi:hypothetical protein